MESILSELVERLRKSHGDRLVSVVLYGSAAMDGAKDRFSDLNVLCILSEITARELAAAEPVLRWWREMSNPSPLLLTRAEFASSGDCFPIEYHDLRDQHRVLFGENVVTGLQVDGVFYRAEVEHELRGKLLRLRQKAGAIVSDRELLLRLMVDSVSTFCVLFRHVLRLAGHPAQFEKRSVIRATGEAFGIDPAPFLSLLDVREGRVKPGSLPSGPLFEQYLQQIYKVIEAVDRMERA